MRFLQILAALLVGLLLVQLSSCTSSRPLAGDQVATVLSQPLDSTVQRQAQLAHLYALPVLGSGRFKFNGPVTFQVGGTGNTAGSTSADKAKAAVAAAPHAVATDSRTSAGSPWYVYLGGALVLFLAGAGLGAWLRGKFSLL